MSEGFDPQCTRCPRLAGHLAHVRARYPGYYAAPVAPFGRADSGLLIVGLAPGMHGANRTGRPFTGDYAGILLYKALHKFGFANQPEATECNDGLQLAGCRITNAVKCLPPQNKPTGLEVRTCNRYLKAELSRIPDAGVVLALGAVAHGAVIRACGLRQAAHPFAHGAEYALPRRRILLDSYHCSRYNTQTRRLTEPMFLEVIRRARELADERTF